MALIVAFWHHSPPIRDRWVWLLLLAIPIYSAKALFFRRLWPRTPFDAAFVAFFLAMLFNWAYAPNQRAEFWVLVCRPLMGMFLVWHFASFARAWRTLQPLLIVSIIITFIVALLALTATQWHVKSVALEPLIHLLPRLPYGDILPDAALSFNPNEIGGALAWVCPLALGLVFYPWGRVWRAYALGAGVLALLALVLGQSRFALGGVLLSSLLGAWLLPQTRRARAVLLAASGALILVQALVLFNVFPVNIADSQLIGASALRGEDIEGGLTSRDETTFATRFQIWESGLKMLRDYPLTGVGMSLFRSVVRREPYIIPHYAQSNTAPPHAHNEWVDISADMGLPGLFIYALWHGIAAWALWRGWRSDERAARVLSLSVALGLLAHMIFGLGDAIRLWDRFAFLFWWLLGLAAAQGVLYGGAALQTPNKLRHND